MLVQSFAVTQMRTQMRASLDDVIGIVEGSRRPALRRSGHAKSGPLDSVLDVLDDGPATSSSQPAQRSNVPLSLVLDIVDGDNPDLQERYRHRGHLLCKFARVSRKLASMRALSKFGFLL